MRTPKMAFRVAGGAFCRYYHWRNEFPRPATKEWGEGQGEGNSNRGIVGFSNPSPQPSPRSPLAGRGSQTAHSGGTGTGVFPKLFARLKVGRGVPTAPCEGVQSRTFRTSSDTRGAVGTPRPTAELFGQHARKTRPMAVLPLLIAALCVGLGHPSLAQVVNGGFESGGFEGWTADPNWVVVDNSCGYYSGWAGKYWAWSGGKGESAMGVLTSRPFVLDKDAVRLLISGWSSIRGTGQPRRWNYVTLNLADGTEIDRVYAPDTTAFVPVFLDGTKHRRKTVFIRAVDDADQATFSMLCVDDVRTADFPRDFARPVKPLPAFDPKRSLRLEDKNCSVEVNRANGSITRIRDKKTGLDLLLEPRLAGSYRFALPIPGKEPWQTIEANWIFGKAQKLTAHRLDSSRLTLRWDGPLRNYLRDPFDVSVTMTIELRDEGVWFGLKINNPTRYAVGETYFPALGGIQGLGTTRGQLRATEMVRPSGALASGRRRRGAGIAGAAPAPAGPGFTTSPIFKSFNNMSWLGDQGPEQFYAYPESQPEPWVGFYAPKASRSVLIGARDPADRSLYLRLELIPANSGTPRDDGNWPRPSELRGAPVGVELSFVDVKGGPVGKPYEAAPVFLRFLDGGGAEMIREYAPWPR